MRYLLHIAYLLAFSLTLQVFHVHLDATEDDAVQCVMCVSQTDDDVLVSAPQAEQHDKQSFIALTGKVIAPLSRNTPQQARSPPKASI